MQLVHPPYLGLSNTSVEMTPKRSCYRETSGITSHHYNKLVGCVCPFWVTNTMLASFGNLQKLCHFGKLVQLHIMTLNTQMSHRWGRCNLQFQLFGLPPPNNCGLIKCFPSKSAYFCDLAMGHGQMY